MYWEVWGFLRIKKGRPKVLRARLLIPKNVRKGSRNRIPNREKVPCERRVLSRRRIHKRRRLLSGRTIPKQKKRLLILPRSIVLRWK